MNEARAAKLGEKKLLILQTIAQMLTTVPTPASYAAAAELWRIVGHPDRAAAVNVNIGWASS